MCNPKQIHGDRYGLPAGWAPGSTPKRRTSRHATELGPDGGSGGGGPLESTRYPFSRCSFLFMNRQQAIVSGTDSVEVTGEMQPAGRSQYGNSENAGFAGPGGNVLLQEGAEF